MNRLLKPLLAAAASTALLCAVDALYWTTIPAGRSSAVAVFALVKLAGYLLYAFALRESYGAGAGDALLVAALRAGLGLAAGWLLWEKLGLYTLAALAPSRWALWSLCLRAGFRKRGVPALEREGDAVGGMLVSFGLDLPALLFAVPLSGFHFHVC